MDPPFLLSNRCMNRRPHTGMVSLLFDDLGGGNLLIMCDNPNEVNAGRETAEVQRLVGVPATLCEHCPSADV